MANPYGGGDNLYGTIRYITTIRTIRIMSHHVVLRVTSHYDVRPLAKTHILEIQYSAVYHSISQYM